MSKYFVFLIFIILSLSVYGLNQPTDVAEYLDMINRGDFNQDAYESYLQRLEGKSTDTALNYFLQAYLLLREYDYNRSYYYFNKSLDLLEKYPDPLLQAEVLFYMSRMELLFYDIPAAIEKSLKLRALSIESDNIDRLIDSNYILASGYQYYYDEKESNKFMEEAYHLAEEENDTYALGYYYILKGDQSLVQANLSQEALEYYNQAYKTLPDITYNQLFLNSKLMAQRAIIYTNLYYLDDQEAFKALGDYIDHIPEENAFYLYDAYALLGDYHMLYDSQASLQAYRKALNYYDKISFIPNSKLTSQNLKVAYATTHYELENYQKAADLFYDLIQEEAPMIAEEDLTETLAALDFIKYEDMNRQMSTLKELNDAQEETITLTRRLNIVLGLSAFILIIAVVVVTKQIKAKNKAQKKLYSVSITDALTQVYNRGKIINIIEEHLEPQNAVALLDIDDFKKINDTYGHLAGDDVLKKLASIIKESIRAMDEIGRYGGEEFILFFENVTPKELHEIGERIRLNIYEHEWAYDALKVSASIGITSCFSKDLDHVLEAVDQLMYEAKNSGKNKCIYKETILV